MSYRIFLRLMLVLNAVAGDESNGNDFTPVRSLNKKMIERTQNFEPVD